MKRNLYMIFCLCAIIGAGCGVDGTGVGDRVGGGGGGGDSGEEGALRVSKELGVLYREVGRAPFAWDAYEAGSEAEALVEGSSADDGTSAMPAPVNPGTPRLRGGEWNDHDHFADYLKWAEGFAGERVYWFDADPRVLVSMRDTAGAAVPNAQVVLSDAAGTPVYRAVTDGHGEAVFFPQMIAATKDAAEVVLVATKGGARSEVRHVIDPSSSATWEVRLDVRSSAPAPLTAVNVAFVLDTTGSMDDEIRQLRETLQAIVRKTRALDASLALRLGVVLFRDHGDDYVTNTTDLTADIDTIQAQIDQAVAEGGGDYREAVSAALHAAVRDLAWSSVDTEAVRLVFLIGDAPPHLDYAQEPHYLEEALVALQKGIKLYPVAASGLDDAGEYVFRQLSLVTMAKFIFISYDGNAPYAVGGYAENNLDTIVFNTIAEEIATYGVAKD